MTKVLAIIGAGHAGSSAALAAARQRDLLHKENDLQIVLLNQTPYLGIRPRYYEYELEQTQVLLTDVFRPVDVQVLVGRVLGLDLTAKTLRYQESKREAKLSFTSVILAAGSEIIQPPIPGVQEYTYNIDTYFAAKGLRTALTDRIAASKPGAMCRIAILGGGLTGIELACELPITVQKICAKLSKPMPQLETAVIDRHQVSANLGKDPQPFIAKALQQAHVVCYDHADISQVKADSVIYNKTVSVPADLIISTLGVRANALARQLDLAKDHLGRIRVNQYLQITGHLHCFAAGDIALSQVDAEHGSIMSCQQGRPQGRYAGHNAVAALYDISMLPYSQPNYVTCVDLGAAGAIYTEGWNRLVKLSGAKAKEIKRHINCERIYPPARLQRDALLAAGKPDFIVPTDSISKKHDGK